MNDHGRIIVFAIVLSTSLLEASCWIVDRRFNRRCDDDLTPFICQSLARDPDTRWTELRPTECDAGYASAPTQRFEFPKWRCIVYWRDAEAECTDGVPPVPCTSLGRGPGVRRTQSLSGFCPFTEN